MKIKVIDYGYRNLPKRAHYNDAGADVYVCLNGADEILIQPHETVKIPLGIGLIIPDGYMACVYPRSGLASKGIVCELPPIDSGYRGEIHAIVTNCSDGTAFIKNGDRIGQLVVTPVIMADFVPENAIEFTERESGAFGSTGA